MFCLEAIVGLLQIRHSLETAEKGYTHICHLVETHIEAERYQRPEMIFFNRHSMDEAFVGTMISGSEPGACSHMRKYRKCSHRDKCGFQHPEDARESSPDGEGEKGTDKKGKGREKEKRYRTQSPKGMRKEATKFGEKCGKGEILQAQEKAQDGELLGVPPFCF